MGHELLVLRLPADHQDPKTRLLGAPVEVEQVDKAVGVHGLYSVDIDHQVPVVATEVIECLMELEARLVGEMAAQVGQHGCAVALDTQGDQRVRFPSVGAAGAV